MLSTLSAPALFAAIEFSLAYLLIGGGFLGAIVVFFLARLFGK